MQWMLMDSTVAGGGGNSAVDAHGLYSRADA